MKLLEQKFLMKISTIECLVKSCFDCDVPNFNRSMNREVVWARKTIMYSVYILGGSLHDIAKYFGNTKQMYIGSIIKWYDSNINNYQFREKTINYFKKLNELLDNESLL